MITDLAGKFLREGEKSQPRMKRGNAGIRDEIESERPENLHGSVNSLQTRTTLN